MLTYYKCIFGQNKLLKCYEGGIFATYDILGLYTVNVTNKVICSNLHKCSYCNKYIIFYNTVNNLIRGLFLLWNRYSTCVGAILLTTEKDGEGKILEIFESMGT